MLRRSAKRAPSATWSTVPLDSLADVPGWDGLARGAAEPNPFFERFMVAPFAALGQAGGRVLCVRQAGGLIGVLPVAPSRGYARLPLRLGANWTHPHLFDATPLVASGREDAFAEGLFAWLDGARPGAPLLHLSRVRAGAVSDALLAVGEAQGRGAAVTQRTQRAFLPTAAAPDLDSYLAAHVGAKTRKSYRRLSRRLAEKGAVRLATLARDDDAEPWLSAFLTCEGAGWKGRNGTALVNDPPAREAFRAAMLSAHAEGRLHVCQLRVEDRAIAHAVDVRAGVGRFALKTAFDEDWEDYSPGMLLEVRMIGAALEAQGAGGSAWVDSCAAPGHTVLSRVWPETRSVLQLLFAQKSARGGAAFRAARLLETASERVRGASDDGD